MRWQILLIILILPSAAAFIEDGRIATQIVVGDDAPATDIILGIDIVTYLQQKAQENYKGQIAQVASDVNLGDGSYIILGLPKDNELAKTLWAASSQKLEGPILRSYGDDFLISGTTRDDLEEAVELFTQGEREAGRAVELQEDSGENKIVTELVKPILQEVDDFEQEIIEPREVVVEIPEDELSKETIQTCQAQQACQNDMLKTTNQDCSVLREFCPYGCDQAKCKPPTVWEKIMNAIFFWNI